MANIEQVDLSDITPDVANLRRHDERSRSAARASFRRFGAARSIVVDGKGIVRAGNASLEAARAAGIDRAIVVDADGDQLVVVRRKDWSDTEATAYGIADNRTTDLSEFDDTALAETLRALQSEDFDLGAVGYTDGEVDELLERLGREAAGADPGDAEAPEEFAEYGEDIETEHRCPKCGYRWSGKSGDGEPGDNGDRS